MSKSRFGYIQRPGFIEKSHAFQRPGFIEGTGDYQWSDKQEASPLGWGTTMRNISKASDIDFTKHMKKFYRKELLGDTDFTINALLTVGGAIAIIGAAYAIGHLVIIPALS
jgi:hypothetical protein